MSQPRNFLLPGENETMHQIMQEHYKKTGQLDKLDPLADPIDLDFDPEKPMGLGFMEMYPVHAVAVYMLSPGEQGEKHGVQKGWELLECWLEPKTPVTEIPPPPPPPEDPEKKDKLFDPWGGNYPRPPPRKVWTLIEVAKIEGTKVVYDVDDVDIDIDYHSDVDSDYHGYIDSDNVDIDSDDHGYIDSDDHGYINSGDVDIDSDDHGDIDSDYHGCNDSDDHVDHKRAGC